VSSHGADADDTSDPQNLHADADADADTDGESALFAMFDEVDGVEWPVEEPELPATQAAFRRRLREMSPTWRSLGIGMGDIFLGYHAGRLWATFGTSDDHGRVHLGDHRVELSDSEWIAAKVHSCAPNEARLEDADPVRLAGGPLTDPDPERAIAPALTWLETTVGRAIFRYHRREDGEYVAGATMSLLRWPDRALFEYPDEDGSASGEAKAEADHERETSGTGPSTVWFPVVDESLGDDAEWTGEDPPFAGAPAAFLELLRQMAPTWEALGITPHDTDAGYDEGRLRVVVVLLDREVDAVFAALRVDLTDSGWSAEWVSPFAFAEPAFWGANPLGEVTGKMDDVETGISDAVAWLAAELRRPVVRYVWRAGGRITSCWWDVDDGVVEASISYPPYVALDPQTADETTRIRA
jgi:hypothetical protein